jgi:hypothetical protein
VREESPVFCKVIKERLSEEVTFKQRHLSKDSMHLYLPRLGSAKALGYRHSWYAL